MLKKQFVTYEIALKLKELGFDESCFDSYYKELPEYGDNIILWKYGDDNFSREEYIWNEICNAPLWQQVIDWFIDKYKIDIIIKSELIGYGYLLYKRYPPKNITNKLLFEKRKEAVESAILEVINLIK